MSLPELVNLAGIGSLNRQPPSPDEIATLMSSARARLHDARAAGLALESRFDLAYNSAHALALAALRFHGFRSGNRYLVFQVLPHTAGIDAVTCRVLSKAHDERNLMEYEGGRVDERLLEGLIEAATLLEERVTALVR